MFKTTLQVARNKYGLKTVSKPNSIQNADTDDLGGFFNDDWNARRFVEQHGSKLINCDNLGGWHLWNGKVWELDETHRVMRLARDTVESFNDMVGAI